jgi:hypothetical protein
MIPTLVFGKRSCSDTHPNRDDKPKKRHHGLVRFLVRLILRPRRMLARAPDAFQRALHLRAAGPTVPRGFGRRPPARLD